MHVIRQRAYIMRVKIVHVLRKFQRPWTFLARVLGNIFCLPSFERELITVASRAQTRIWLSRDDVIGYRLRVPISIAFFESHGTRRLFNLPSDTPHTYIHTHAHTYIHITHSHTHTRTRHCASQRASLSTMPNVREKEVGDALPSASANSQWFSLSWFSEAAASRGNPAA